MVDCFLFDFPVAKPENKDGDNGHIYHVVNTMHL